MRGLIRSLIRAYQRTISPFLGRNCRFYPSCSEYSAAAFNNFGLFRAAGLSLWRVVRCQPFSKGGFDPLPADRAKNNGR